MKTLPTRLQGLVLIEPHVRSDERGFFLETFRKGPYSDLGITHDFLQDNHSRSRSGSVRALHFQVRPGQPKLVRVARGRAFDVVVDIRRSSPTFGQWESFELDDVRHLQLYIPIGFAHGSCALSETVDFIYKVGSYYDAKTEHGIAWDDPDLAIPWPVANPNISPRDRNHPTLASITAELPDW